MCLLHSNSAVFGIRRLTHPTWPAQLHLHLLSSSFLLFYFSLLFFSYLYTHFFLFPPSPYLLFFLSLSLSLSLSIFFLTGTPVNRIPIMAKHVLDLYELYRLVVARGGLVEVINKKIWREITKGLNLPSSITSAAFTLRTQ